MQLLSGSPAALNCSPLGGGGRTASGTTASDTTASDTTTVDAGNGKTLSFTREQRANAGTIIAVGRGLNVPSRGVQVALMTALQESGLRNLDHGDRDSVGIFQQRANWGSLEERQDPTYEAKAFYGGPLGPNRGTPKGLLDVANWQDLSLNDAAQAVQISGFPKAYAKWESSAASLMTERGVNVTADTASQTISNGGGCSSGGGSNGGGSGGKGSDTENASWSSPNGKTGADMVAYAEQYVGKVPYSGACGSAGSPTAGWCCTGFVYYMYHQVLDVDLPSTVVSGQLAQAHQIPASKAQAGDLVAWVGHHIGIYDGKGGLIHSPDWGRKLTHAKSYQFTIGGTGPTFWRVNAIGDGTW
ncbi:C40 family peptidase (plasmid) [Curtobacterium flaccumfaciens pv. flaccumfaciens]|uniref:C40 family peptidase n=3 Tax=Microbacteriaceae TaxID=85023 RepID=A0A5P8YVR9_9MICO|nr:NlpC/P60 family protein [Curtobacterium flaccumfaciens]MBO9041465.1 C40 family peptidase [Curtobacterium flaccumfaciens pv. flaccumfaciens]MBO9044951.1 C40 family peptidase [Curtobacterium flaccumfaciens pv. flaccumfaciens]MBO9048906.1 C40 family peptidase [Curtobacterium flaccumfaciens pv. flaccumfaciens]MBO9057757.1 C40 family peptidase [Curtobacterium flaccumfaciens pv. flaccumfaciens]MBT1543196.1 C40 family peptidase [Curtobacterium flaccumfaciens pv. flaccumfaciens]